MSRFVMSVVACLMAGPVAADMPGWMSGDWRTNARLTAPDGAQMRIRCTLDADASGGQWGGVLGCATVQGRFESRWDVAIAAGAASGQVVFDGPEAGQMAVTGTAGAELVALSAADGQGVRFSPGPDGALVVEMQALGPQRLSGALTFEPR